MTHNGNDEFTWILFQIVFKTLHYVIPYKCRCYYAMTKNHCPTRIKCRTEIERTDTHFKLLV